jgi:hypothetical protein
MKAITQTTVNQWSAHLSVGGLRRWWTLGSLTRHRDQPAAAHLLAQCPQKNAPLSMSQRAEKALHRITSQPAKDAVIDCWLEGKAGETVRQIIEERGWRHSDEARWLKFLTQRNRFDEYFVAQLAPQVNQPAIARMLAHPEGADASQGAAGAAAVALGQISAPETVDTVIDCWLEDKAGETARQVIEEQGWRHSDEARWLKFLTQRNRFDEYFVAQLAPLIDQYETIARMMARLEREDASQALFVAAAAALGQISAPEAVDSLIDCWLEARAGGTVREVVDAWGWLRYTEAPWLEFSNKRNERPAKTVQKVIEDMGWRHSDEAQWLKFLTQRNRFDEYFVAQLATLVNQPAVARMLAHPEDDRASEVAAGAAAVALSQISAPESIDAVIDCWLEDKAGETARQVIEQRRWRHSEEARWLLYLAATGRFDEYLAEDYEFQTLRPEFLASPAALKARIREAVVKAGEVRMNGLFLAEKRAAELTVADAEALVHINIRNQNWEALAGNLWWLPARQILDAVQAIIAAKWKPHDADQAALLARLVEITPLLAMGAPERPDALPLNPVYQKWLNSGETGPLSSKLPVELKAMIEDEVDPPDQIAALGALRKQGQLDVATVAKAGLSEHWMVRWVAVHFGADLTRAMRVNDAGIEWFRRLTILRTDGDAEALWTAKPCEITRDGLEALSEHLARLPDPRAAGGLLLVEAICTHYTGHDFEVEEGARVLVAEDSFELEG